VALPSIVNETNSAFSLLKLTPVRLCCTEMMVMQSIRETAWEGRTCNQLRCILQFDVAGCLRGAIFLPWQRSPFTQAHPRSRKNQLILCFFVCVRARVYVCLGVYCAHVYPYARISASFTVAYYACVSFFHAFIAQVCFVERSNLPLIKGRQVCYRPYSNEDHKCVLIIPLRVILTRQRSP